MSTPQGDADAAHAPIRLSDLGSGRLTTRAFSVPARPQRFRRPTDVVLLVLAFVILAVTASVVDDPGDFDTTFAQWLSNLPGLLDFLWKIAYDFVQIWVVVVGVLALGRRRWGLLRDWAVSIALTVGGVLLVGWLVDGEVPALADSIGTADGPGAFPSLALAAGAATIAVASPYFVSPLRTFGRWLIGTAWLAALVLGVTAPGAGLSAVAIGWAAGALVHLVFGSPDGAMSLDDLRQALRSVGVDAEPTRVEARNGVIVAEARTPDDRQLDVHVHGRDSWDSQFFVKMWRLVFYRSGGRNVTVNRRHQIEHQAYLTLYAQREGALVAPLVAAAMDQRGDALFVTERVGPAFGADGEGVDDALAVECMEVTGAAPRRRDPPRRHHPRPPPGRRRGRLHRRVRTRHDRLGRHVPATRRSATAHVDGGGRRRRPRDRSSRRCARHGGPDGDHDVRATGSDAAGAAPPSRRRRRRHRRSPQGDDRSGRRAKSRISKRSVGSPSATW